VAEKMNSGCGSRPYRCGVDGGAVHGWCVGAAMLVSVRCRRWGLIGVDVVKRWCAAQLRPVEQLPTKL
jgi:hypothetical protein